MLLTLSINIPVIVPVSPISERQPRVFCLHRLRVLTFFFAKMRQIRLRQLRMLGFQMNILLIIVWLSVNSNSPCSEASIIRAALCPPLHCTAGSGLMSVGRKMLQKVWSGLKLGTRPASAGMVPPSLPSCNCVFY